MAKLHRVQGSNAYRFLVEVGERVVDDRSRATFVLWDDAHGTDTQARQVANVPVGKDHPLGLVHHVRELSPKKVDVILGRAVGAAVHGGIRPRSSPWGSLEDHRRTSMLVLAKDAACWMCQCVEVR